MAKKSFKRKPKAPLAYSTTIKAIDINSKKTRRMLKKQKSNKITTAYGVWDRSYYSE